MLDAYRNTILEIEIEEPLSLQAMQNKSIKPDIV